jgi:two-component system sensor histidine kinase HydH
MFRVQQSDVSASLMATASVVLGLLVLSLGLSFAGLMASPGGRSAPDPLALLLTLLLGTTTAVFVWHWRRDLAAQRALRRVKLLAHDILASMDQGVITSDTDGRVTSINSGAMRLLAVGEECVGLPLDVLSTSTMPIASLGRSVIEKHETVRDREFGVDRGGQVVRLLISAYELKGTKGETLGGIIHVRDVTERVRMLEQMWRLERLAGLSTLAAGLHHEVKNPLTALSLHVQLVDERLRDAGVAGSISDLLGVVKGELQRLNGVLERFRSFANLDKLMLSPTDVPALLGEITRLIQPQAEGQGVVLRLEQNGARPPRVTLDADKFRQAVLNLVVNALEAMPGGGELTLATLAREGGVEVEVRDTGPGIPEEVRENLFRPYVSTKGRGTGIGLPLAEKLIGQHGGRITYETGPRGTTFRMSLPVAARAAGSARGNGPP